jgi:hypothetical protein
MSSKLSNLEKLRTFVRIDGAHINSGAPLAGAGEGEQMWCITATNATSALCEWDASSRKMSSKFSKFTDVTKFARIAVARLNWGAPLAGADNIKRMGCITATNATVALCEWDASLKEMSSKLPNLAELRKFVCIDGARINSGAPLAGVGDGEQMWCTVAINAMLALCEWDASLREMSSHLSNLTELRKSVRIDGARIHSGAPTAGAGDGEQKWCIAATDATLALSEWDASSRKVSSKLPRATSLKKVDLIDERGQRCQTKGKFGGNGRSSRSRSPGKDNHETARGPQ